MKLEQARRILIACRPEIDRQDSDVVAALALAERDAELACWWREQQEVQAVLRDQFRSLPVPANFKDQLLAEIRIVRPVFWRRAPIRLSAAAAVLVLLLSVMVRQPAGNGLTLAQFRDRMVRTVIREYRMDITTSSEAEIRGYLTQARGHADFQLPVGVAGVPYLGAGRLSWQGHPVSMVCFQRQTGVPMYLFVIDREAFTTPPEARMPLEMVAGFATASWSAGDDVYVLASDTSLDDLGSQLK